MAIKNLEILVIDDDPDVLIAMRLLLNSVVKKVVVEKNPEKIIPIIKNSKWDIVILDMNFKGVINSGNEGLYWLKKIKTADENIEVILITAYGEIELAIKSLKMGASNFLVKPWKNDKLLQIIKDIGIAKRVSKTSELHSKGYQLLGESSLMQKVNIKIQKVAPTDANILILGENGTGKDLIARAIHDNSLRKNRPFVKVDLGALTSTLFESELFGHTKGAFSGAIEVRKGRFEIADGGTLFLDEIGNISLYQQARLLTVLQNREFTPIGSNEVIPIDIRLICATNLGIEKLGDDTKFRKDLIYRINTVELVLPPLRERSGDIVLLAHHFLKLYSEKYSKESLVMDKSFLKKLRAYHFSGNVRELQYIIEKTVILSEGKNLSASDLVFSPIENRIAFTEPADLKLTTTEKNTIIKVIEKNNGNLTRSAIELGITRTALYRRLSKYGLS